MVQALAASGYSPYRKILREEWKLLNGRVNFRLKDEEMQSLGALNEPLTFEEIEDIYAPLSHFLQFHVESYRALHERIAPYLQVSNKPLPYIIGIAGSVAAGKSTTARVLQKLLSMHPLTPKVDLVTTDGFLYPNAELERRGILNRKGFPESYHTKHLLSFLSAVKGGQEEVEVPLYSHLTYDVLPDQFMRIQQPDILIVEGINVLQVNSRGGFGENKVFVSDFFDYAIYVDADADHLEHWYINRFESLRKTAFQHPQSYFKKYANFTETESIAMARKIWKEINAPNLLQNIQPTRFRSNMILKKGANHFVEELYIRKT
jgi:type I pantothenate kinase